MRRLVWLWRRGVDEGELWMMMSFSSLHTDLSLQDAGHETRLCARSLVYQYIECWTFQRVRSRPAPAHPPLRLAIDLLPRFRPSIRRTFRRDPSLAAQSFVPFSACRRNWIYPLARSSRLVPSLPAAHVRSPRGRLRCMRATASTRMLCRTEDTRTGRLRSRPNGSLVPRQRPYVRPPLFLSPKGAFPPGTFRSSSRYISRGDKTSAVQYQTYSLH